MIKLSICVPIYGTEKYIERCARSLFDQDIQDVEYIFVNDCTKDAAIDVLKNVVADYPYVGSRVKIINHEKNKGLAGARLTGLQNATGEYVWCVDSDDYIQQKAIMELAPYMDGINELIAFNYFYDRNGEITRFTEKPFTVSNVLMNIVSPSIWKCVVKRSLFFDNGIFPIVGINVSEDYLLLARLIVASKKTLFLDSKYLYFYELGNEGSYLHNPSLKSVENTADATIIVAQYYIEKDIAKQYKEVLFIKLVMAYLSLVELDKCNLRCGKLINTIKEINPFMFQLVFLFGHKKLNLIVNVYKKIVFRGGVYNLLYEIYSKTNSKRFIKMLRKHHIKIGDNVVFRAPRSTHIDMTRPSLITIGHHVDINVNFHLYTHDWTSFVFRQVFHDFINSSGKVTIGNNVYIAANVIVLKGVTIGDNCIIGAGSVVNRDIPSNSVAVGNPCRVVCTLEEFYNKRKHRALNEAKEYVESIRERFGREPQPEDLWEEFGYFIDARNKCKYPQIPVEFQLAEGYEEWMKNHNAQFDGLDEFLKYLSSNK